MYRYDADIIIRYSHIEEIECWQIEMSLCVQVYGHELCETKFSELCHNEFDRPAMIQKGEANDESSSTMKL